MSGLTLIASYPKSGNTWMRAFLTSLAKDGVTPDINEGFGDIRNLAYRDLFDACLDMEGSDLTDAEVRRLRPWVSRQVLGRPGSKTFKIHDANLPAPNADEPPVPADVITKVIYIVRDPRDVLVSNTYHSGKSPDYMAGKMADHAHTLARPAEDLKPQVEQYLSSWSHHVESWLESDLPLHWLRYEDMLADPVRAFTGAVQFLGLDAGEAAIARATQAVRFERLAEQEARAGFRERPAIATTPFFRQGQAGGWRTQLAPELATRIEKDHGPMMRRLGYL